MMCVLFNEAWTESPLVSREVPPARRWRGFQSSQNETALRLGKVPLAVVQAVGRHRGGYRRQDPTPSLEMLFPVVQIVVARHRGGHRLVGTTVSAPGQALMMCV